MKAVVTKENFRKILSSVGHVVGHTATLPILSNILLQTDKGRLKISATNLEIGLTAWLGGRVEDEGSVTLPARTITDYIATTIGDQVNLETKDNTLVISTDTSSASVKTLPPEEFPLIPQITPAASVKVSAQELRAALAEVVFSAAPLETQPELSGVYLYIEGEKLFLVATDRYRLTERAVALPQGEPEGEFKPVVVPLRTAQEVGRLLATITDDSLVHVVQGENQVLFKLPDLEMVSRLVDTKFPDYKHLIPTAFNSEATISRFELSQAVKSAGLFAATSRSVKVSFRPTGSVLEVYAASGDVGESKVSIKGELTGQEQEITFNYRYIADYLNNISDETIVFKSVNDNAPTIISPKERTNSLYLVMPTKN